MLAALERDLGGRCSEYGAKADLSVVCITMTGEMYLGNGHLVVRLVSRGEGLELLNRGTMNKLMDNNIEETEEIELYVLCLDGPGSEVQCMMSVENITVMCKMEIMCTISQPR
jgi:hypothetical protein